jgi:hypothetical protein
MLDIKTQNNLAGDEWWVKIGAVAVWGNPSAQAMPTGATQAEGEQTVQTWQRVAVLDVGPDAPEFYVGFLVGEHSQFMRSAVQTDDGKFGMHVGDGDVTFYVIPTDLQTSLQLKLVEVTDMSDSRYDELPIY